MAVTALVLAASLAALLHAPRVAALPYTNWPAARGATSDDGPPSLAPNAVCIDKYNHAPTAAEGYTYQRVQPVSPRIQWGDAGGYCGSMAVQNVAMGKGVWVSQQQVRHMYAPLLTPLPPLSPAIMILPAFITLLAVGQTVRLAN